MSADPGREYVLTLSCPDKPGIVYAVSSFLVQHSANILASQQYGESPDGRFFMRVHFSVPPPPQRRPSGRWPSSSAASPGSPRRSTWPGNCTTRPPGSAP